MGKNIGIGISVEFRLMGTLYKFTLQKGGHGLTCKYVEKSMHVNMSNNINRLINIDKKLF